MTFKFTRGLHQCLLYYYDFMIFISILFPFVQISTKLNQKMCDEAIDDKFLAHTADSLSSPCGPAIALNDVYTCSFSLPAVPPAEIIFIHILNMRKQTTREGKPLAWGHTAQGTGDANRSLTPEHFLPHSRKEMALTPQQRSLPWVPRTLLTINMGTHTPYRWICI